MKTEAATTIINSVCDQRGVLIAHWVVITVDDNNILYNIIIVIIFNHLWVVGNNISWYHNINSHYISRIVYGVYNIPRQRVVRFKIDFDIYYYYFFFYFIRLVQIRLESIQSK